MNQINLIGRLGSDPTTKQVGDTSVTDFSLAVSEKFKDKSGNKVEQTDWFNCQAWGKAGEVIAQYVKKGHALYITGRSKVSTYEKNGEKKYAHFVRVDGFEFMQNNDAPKAQTNQVKETAVGFQNSNDDLPF